MKNQESFNILKETNNILKKLNLKYYLDGGTLLGAYRDKDFCEDDELDIDLSTLCNFSDYKESLKLFFQKEGFSLYHEWDESYYLDNFKKISSSQISFEKNKVKIDLMFKKVKNNKIWWTIFDANNVIYKCTPKKYVISDEHFYSELYFNEIVFNAPFLIKEYLTFRYGDFSVKIHASKYSCYNSDKSIIGSYEEI